MNLEPITQSEVNQKEKDKYCILIHIYGILKNSNEEFLQGSNGDTDIPQVYSLCLGKRRGWDELRE